MASAAVVANPSTSARSSVLYVRLGADDTNVIAPSERVRATSGTLMRDCDRDDSAVAREQPVVQMKWCAGLARCGDVGEHPLAVFGMEEPLEQVGLGEPFPSRVAEKRLDLRIDLERCRSLTRRIGVCDHRQV